MGCIEKRTREVNLKVEMDNQKRQGAEMFLKSLERQFNDKFDEERRMNTTKNIAFTRQKIVTAVQDLDEKLLPAYIMESLSMHVCQECVDQSTGEVVETWPMMQERLKAKRQQEN